jgi:hypothetical protein
MSKDVSISPLHLTDEEFNYLEASARIRKISCTRLIARMLHTIFTDQLILGVLDDESKQPVLLPGEDHPSHFYQSTRKSH